MSEEHEWRFSGDRLSRLWKTGAARAESVKAVQKFLRADNWYNGEIDGEWGPATFAAMEDWQQAEGESVDGCFGPHSADKAQEFITPNFGDCDPDPNQPCNSVTFEYLAISSQPQYKTNEAPNSPNRFRELVKAGGVFMRFVSCKKDYSACDAY